MINVFFSSDHLSVENLLTSINLQENKEDINVYYVRYASNQKNEELLSIFSEKLNISIIDATEDYLNACLDISKRIPESDFYLFFDNADYFYDLFSAQNIVKFYNNQNFDVADCFLLQTSSGSLSYTNNIYSKVFTKTFLERIDYSSEKMLNDLCAVTELYKIPDIILYELH